MEPFRPQPRKVSSRFMADVNQRQGSDMNASEEAGMGAGPLHRNALSMGGKPAAISGAVAGARRVSKGGMSDQLAAAQDSHMDAGPTTKPRSPATTYLGQHAARMQHASGTSPHLQGAAKPGSPGSSYASSPPQPEDRQPASGRQLPAPIPFGPLDIPPLKLSTASRAPGASAADGYRGSARPGGVQGELGSPKGAGVVAPRSSLDAARRHSHDGGALGKLPQVEDRRELLKRYKEAKQQQGGGVSGLQGAAPDMRPAAARLSLGGRPPMPGGRAVLPRHPMPATRPLAHHVVEHAAATPLPDGNDSTDLLSPHGHKGAPHVTGPTGTEGGLVPRLMLAPKLSVPRITRQPDTQEAAEWQADGLGVQGAPLDRRASMGSLPNSGSSAGVGAGARPPSGTLTPRTSGGGGGAPSHQAGGDARQGEGRALRLAALQWRYLIAKAARALSARQDQSEKALAACALAVSQLHATAAVGQALQARAAEQQRTQQVLDAQREHMDQWACAQARLGGQLTAVGTSLHDSLTNVPLVAGAHCGGGHAPDIAALELSMDRGMDLMMQLDAALQPVLAAATSGGAGAEGGSSAQGHDLHLPTALILQDLVGTVGQEIGLLADVLKLSKTLKAKQQLLHSHQVQAAQMQRAGQLAL